MQRRDADSRAEGVSTRYVGSRNQGLRFRRQWGHGSIGLVSSRIVCARFAWLRIGRLLLLLLGRVGILLLLLLMRIRRLLLRVGRGLWLLLLSVPEGPGIESRLWGTGWWREHHAVVLRVSGGRARRRRRELHRGRVGHGRGWRHVLLLRLLLLLLAQKLFGSCGRYMALLARRVVRGWWHCGRGQMLWQGTSRGIVGIGEVFGMGKGTGTRTRATGTWLDGRVRRITDGRRGPQKVARVERGHVVQDEAVLCPVGGLGSWLVVVVVVLLLLATRRLLLRRVSSGHFRSSRLRLRLLPSCRPTEGHSRVWEGTPCRPRRRPKTTKSPGPREIDLNRV